MSELRAPWQKEENRIYLRDILFMFITIAISVAIPEIFLLSKDSTLVDRIFSYLLLFIPLGTVNLIAHYYYRNRRIRVTGNLRSSLRYRLSLAFMLVAVIPSIPIFLISSDMMQHVVEGFFRIDAAGALESAETMLDYHKVQENKQFLERLKAYRPDYFRSATSGVDLIMKLYSDRILFPGLDYAAYISTGRMVYQTNPVIKENVLPEFESIDPSGLKKVELVMKDKDLILFQFPMAYEGDYLIIGRRLLPGLEKERQKFDIISSRFRNETEWRKKIPTTLRLALGLIYVFMICLALVISLIIARQISLPIVSLAAATREVTDGKLDTRIDIQSTGELGILIDSFNQMTTELQSLRARLLHSQRVAAWQEVAKRLAHEIKNPLTPIQLSADRMLRRLDHPEKGDLRKIVQSGAVTIVEQVKVLKEMVEEFANFARMPEARPVANLLDTIVSEAVNLFRGLPGFSVEMRLAGNLPLIDIDKNIIIGLINNLIKNAVEAIESVPEELRRKPEKIIISTAQHRIGGRKYVMLKVEDSGPGIDEELADKIFEPYFSTKGEHGSGLGLSLVERAVLEHNARIYVGRSFLGGAEFRILFPMKENENIHSR